ncbi:MAG TPA: DNA-processing protein DprA [Magnetospirillaceae bacterium]|nr:DNA-processing protein DprA [Magnetospirillaceae bacterium]
MYKINTISTDKLLGPQIDATIARIPKSLYLLGTPPNPASPSLAVIGTRKPTVYGQEVAYRLAFELAKRGVVIVSGLALGTDSIAHKAALDAGGITIAVMPGGLDEIYPRSNVGLARRIVQTGGALISEYAPGAQPYQSNFVARNRIVAALASGILVVEAAAKSGTMHTAGFALDFGKPVMAVPGAITNTMSTGTNNLIATGARLIRNTADILDEINVGQPAQQTSLPLGDTSEESTIIKLIAGGTQDGDELQIASQLTPALFSQTLTMLEINGVIRAGGGNTWTLAGY